MEVLRRGFASKLRSNIMTPVLAAAVLIALAFVVRTSAQTLNSRPQLLITWSALSSEVPPGYHGKALPGINSQVSASVTAISNGKPIDLSSYTVYWYMDDNFLGGGIGKQSITFSAPGYAEIVSLRAQIPDFPGGFLVNTVHFQLASPRVVIAAPYEGNTFSQPSVSVQALPYFFNVAGLDKLSFQWMVNGQVVATQENPQDLTVNLGSDAPSGYSLSINLSIRQGDNPSVGASASVVLTKTTQ